MSAVLTTTGAKASYFAQPYNLGAVGFYFEDLEDYQSKAEGLRDDCGNPVEEFELQYIDGDHARLFSALNISQAYLSDWFDLLDELGDDEDRYLIACHLADMGYDIGELSRRWDDYRVYRGTAGIMPKRSSPSVTRSPATSRSISITNGWVVTWCLVATSPSLSTI